LDQSGDAFWREHLAMSELAKVRARALPNAAKAGFFCSATGFGMLPKDTCN
jgi:hypothetical protein